MNYVILKCAKFALRTTSKDSTAAWQINLAGDGCDDVDECTSTVTPHNCHTDAFCTNNDGSFLCTCNPTYIGRSIFSRMAAKFESSNFWIECHRRFESTVKCRVEWFVLVQEN